MESVTKRENAQALFREGYNCSQAVVLAFEEELGADRETLARMASSFGGGLGRLREVCGAVSGMALVYGCLRGYSAPDDLTGKKEQYTAIQTLAGEVEKRHGSIICREIIKSPQKHGDPDPAPRTPEYYAVRPCERMVGDAAEILETFLRENPAAPR